MAENEGSSEVAEHCLRSQGEVEADHAAEGVQGVAAAFQRARRQRERIRRLCGVGGRRKQSGRDRTEAGGSGEAAQ